MALADWLSPTVVMPILVGVAMVALAGWLLALDFADKLHRSFAVFLVVRAGHNATWGTERIPGLYDISANVTPYFVIATVFAAAYLGLVFWRREGHDVPLGSTLALVVTGAAAFELLYGFRHDLWFHEPGSPGKGPLSVFYPLLQVAYMAIAFLFFREWRRAGPGVRGPALVLVSLAFALNPAFFVGLEVWVIVLAGGLVDHPGRPFGPAAMPAVALILAQLLHLAYHLMRVARSREAGAPRVAARIFLALMGVAFVSAAPAAWVALQGSEALVIGIDGLWTITMPLVTAYAMVRHRLFHANRVVHRTFRRGTLATAYVVLFFVLSEGTQAVLQDRTQSAAAAIVGTAVLLLFLAPFQRFAERVADTAVPDPRQLDELARDERLALYAEQLRVAWSDGALTKKDRALLDVARQRLRLRADDVVRIETEIAARA